MTSPQPAASATAVTEPTAPERDRPPAHAPADAGDLGDARSEQDANFESSEPTLSAEDGSPLPQTDTRPDVATPRFHNRMQRLFRAIAEDKPELALDTFFPLVAYQQVKDIAKPERDYRMRLLKAFERDIHDYHRKLGEHAERADLWTIAVPNTARMMKPGSEGNKIAYWRVLRSEVRYRDEAKVPHSLTITSMISWRGEWYVVHLAGFK